MKLVLAVSKTIKHNGKIGNGVGVTNLAKMIVTSCPMVANDRNRNSHVDDPNGAGEISDMVEYVSRRI